MKIWGLCSGVIYHIWSQTIYCVSPSSTSRTSVIYLKICHAVLSILLRKGLILPMRFYTFYIQESQHNYNNANQEEILVSVFLLYAYLYTFLFWHVDRGLAYDVTCNFCEPFFTVFFMQPILSAEFCINPISF